jgi:hypothetical protein
MRKRLRLQLKVAKLRGFDGDLCFYCGQPMQFTPPPDVGAQWKGKHRATVEHLIDRKFGGTRDVFNAVLAHGRCNSDRSHMTLAEKLASRHADALPVPMRVQQTISQPERTLSLMRANRRSHGVELSRLAPFQK